MFHLCLRKYKPAFNGVYQVLYQWPGTGRVEQFWPVILVQMESRRPNGKWGFKQSKVYFNDEHRLV